MLAWQMQLSKRCMRAALLWDGGTAAPVGGGALGVAIVFTLRRTVWIIVSGGYVVCLCASAVSLCVYELLVCPVAVVAGGGQSSR